MGVSTSHVYCEDKGRKHVKGQVQYLGLGSAKQMLVPIEITGFELYQIFLQVAERVSESGDVDQNSYFSTYCLCKL